MKLQFMVKKSKQRGEHARGNSARTRADQVRYFVRVKANHECGRTLLSPRPRVGRRAGGVCHGVVCRGAVRASNILKVRSSEHLRVHEHDRVCLLVSAVLGPTSR